MPLWNWRVLREERPKHVPETDEDRMFSFGKIKYAASNFIFLVRESVFMNDEKYDEKKYSLIDELSSELNKMHSELYELRKIKADYEMELSRRKSMEESFNVVKASLEDKLAWSQAELKRVTEQSGLLKASLEEELLQSQTELNRIKEEHQREIQTWKDMVQKLQQSMSQINILTNSFQKIEDGDGLKPGAE